MINKYIDYEQLEQILIIFFSYLNFSLNYDLFSILNLLHDYNYQIIVDSLYVVSLQLRLILLFL